MTRPTPTSTLFPYTTLFRSLRALLTGKTSALVGHSGVGKSSILNALDISLSLATADVLHKKGTGRHTTTSSTLLDRKSTRLNSSHLGISYAVFCLKKKKKNN